MNRCGSILPRKTLWWGPIAVAMIGQSRWFWSSSPVGQLMRPRMFPGFVVWSPQAFASCGTMENGSLFGSVFLLAELVIRSQVPETVMLYIEILWGSSRSKRNPGKWGKLVWNDPDNEGHRVGSPAQRGMRCRMKCRIQRSKQWSNVCSSYQAASAADSFHMLSTSFHKLWGLAWLSWSALSIGAHMFCLAIFIWAEAGLGGENLRTERVVHSFHSLQWSELINGERESKHPGKQNAAGSRKSCWNTIEGRLRWCLFREAEWRILYCPSSLHPVVPANLTTVFQRTSSFRTLRLNLFQSPCYAGPLAAPMGSLCGLCTNEARWQDQCRGLWSDVKLKLKHDSKTWAELHVPVPHSTTAQC